MIAILPVVVGPAMTRKCVESLLAQDIPIDVLAIDNGSQDGAGHLLRSMPIGVVSNPQRVPLNKLWNKWINHAFYREGQDCVLVVNNDTIIRHDTARLLRDDGGPFVTAVGVRGEVTRSAAWRKAESEVKISHFTRKGFEITGVVHVGANDGYEISRYLELGAKRVIVFEPSEIALKTKYEWGNDPRVTCFWMGLGEREESRELHITSDTMGSSFLHEYGDRYQVIRTEQARIRRFDSLGLDIDLCNTLVVDVQGMELSVLRGFGDLLPHFDFLNIECSKAVQYEGGVTAQQVIDYLDGVGFSQDSPIPDGQDDIFFIKKGLKLATRPHPDFSCFLIRRECWERVGPFDESIHAFFGDNDYHLRMHRAGIKAYSLPVPFQHLASGTMKLASNELRDQIQAESDQDREVFRKKYGFLPATKDYEVAFA